MTLGVWTAPSGHGVVSLFWGYGLPDRIVRPGAGLACIEDKYANGLLHNERSGLNYA
jgi:hypothetical protein